MNTFFFPYKRKIMLLIECNKKKKRRLSCVSQKETTIKKQQLDLI